MSLPNDADEQTRTLGGGGPPGPPPSATWPNALGDPRFAPPATLGDLGTLGKYRIHKELGRGGMGIVYAATDTRLERPVALKVMRPVLAVDPVARERFLREARAAARISSDHVVSIFEADEFDGTAYIAMPRLTGQPLDRVLDRWGPPAVPVLLRIGREAATGLAAAHALGIVHRDIKPANLWLEEGSERVKLLDFGLAKPVAGNSELTASGTVSGTPSYMAPEQGLGHPVDGRADLFSLGCVLYRLSTGALPFDGTTAMAVMLAAATAEPTPVEELNPAVPPALAGLLRRLMAKDPNRRPPTAELVADEFAALERQLVRDPAARRAFLDPDERTTPLRLPTRRPLLRSRGLLFAGIAAAVAVAVAVAVALAVWNRTRDEQATTPDGPPLPQLPLPELPQLPLPNPQPQLPQLPPPNPNPQLPPVADPDRAAALALGDEFDLDLRFLSGMATVVQCGQPLPDQPFVIRSLFAGKKPLPPGHFARAVLPKLAALGSLEGFHDQYAAVPALTAADLDALAKLPLRRTLMMMGVCIQMTPKAVARLAQFPALRAVHFDAKAADGATVVASLAELPAGVRVEWLWGLGRTEPFGKDAWAALAKAIPYGPHTTNAKVSVGFAKVIAGMSELSAVTLMGAEFEAGALAEIGKSPTLSVLNLRESNFGGDDIPALVALPKLISVNVMDTKLTADELRKLQEALPKCMVYGGVGPPR